MLKGPLLPFMRPPIQGAFLPAADMSMMIHLMEIMPKGSTGMVMGIYSESENVGGMMASPSLGFVYEILGPTTSIFTVTGALILNAVLSMLIVDEGSRKE
jgi:nitrate/nitrite transporter NarK